MVDQRTKFAQEVQDKVAAENKAAQDALKEENKKNRANYYAEADTKVRQDIREENWKKWEETMANQRGGAEAYNEWTTGMNNIVNSLKAFNAALASEWNVKIPWGHPQLLAGWKSVPSYNPSWDKSDTLKFTDDCTYVVGLDDNGVLHKQAYFTQKEGDKTTPIPIPPGAQQPFDDAFNEWAQNNNLTIQPDGKVKDQTGRELDKADFDRLKKDPTNGFHTFINNKLGLSMTDTTDLQESSGLTP
ncbi:Uncharacterised protein [Legionella lansingensis]|uniref:Uncharacterized protein n=1 Tax=Legionella lansingensis TaxID=45067 RepID=A0A0W0VSF5_9GAMM|nr:hypothetical protein [Legionella lansingensis]KTD23088.1 hypothetical protein Llan_0926 [Legionella lansingensis]SNV51210.1 Uncharacterised protein [Legionella lansingensis]